MKMNSAKMGLLVAVLLAMPSSTSAEAPPSYTESSVCATCHTEIYDSWSHTFHALAAIDPIFQEAMKRAEQISGPAVREICLMCHAPTTNVTADFDLQLPLTSEGVTCSFCHSLTALDLSLQDSRFTNDPTRLSVDGSDNHIEGHHVENHELTTSSRFCAGCHEWVNPKGLNLLTTYSEWRESPYAADGTTCQECHMPEGPVEEGSGGGAKTMRSSNLHFQTGGHSQARLIAAAELEVEAKIDGEEIVVEAVVTNRKAGHKLPTGIPTRKMKLHVDLFDREGNILQAQEKVYGRIIADTDGVVLEDVTDLFLLGARQVDDNRIAPREERRERFLFPPVAGLDFYLVEASLVYEILPPLLSTDVLHFDVDRKRIPLSLSEPGEGPAGGRTSSTTLPLLIIAGIFLAVTAVMVHWMKKKSGGRSARERKE
jgi:hypothetical protein